MRRIDISEEDKVLFTNHITDSEYLYYVDHKDAFRCMWKEQGRVFWAYTVTKFRLCVFKHGHLHPFVEMATNGALDYPFIRICEKMTSKYGELTEMLDDINIVSMNRHLVHNMIKPTFASDPFINPSTRTAFRNLFGPPDDKRRILRTYLFAEVYCTWGGALMRLLMHWVDSPPTKPWWNTTNDTFPWKPPACYVDARLRYQPTLFERYLKQAWSDNITRVCGTASAYLVWWSRVEQSGSLQLPPLQEYHTLSAVMEVLLSVIDPRSPLLASVTGGVTPATSAEPPPPGKPTGIVEETLLRLPPNSKAAKNRKKKEKKRQKAVVAADGDSGQLEPQKPQKPLAPVEVMGEQLAPPEVATTVAEATRDWHQYAPEALAGSDLLKRQLIGGQLFLGWIGYMLKDSMYYLIHLDASQTSALQSRQESVSAQLVSVKQVLCQADGRNTAAMRKARDGLTDCIREMKQVLTSLYPLRVGAGPDPRSELKEIRRLVARALDSPLLYVYPALVQYSLTETPEKHADARLVFPDLSRWRHCIRKGVAFLAASAPLTVEGREAAELAALDWYRELAALPSTLQHHLTAHLRRADGTIRLRLAQPRPCRQRHNSMELTDPGDEFGVILWALEELQRLSVEGGCAPRHTTVRQPHFAQSVVDLFWARLSGMMFFIDLMSLFCCCSAIRDQIQKLKLSELWELMGAVLGLQVAQCRWLHPRAELDLPKRPAMERAADGRLWQHHLNVATNRLQRTHQHLSAVYAAFRQCRRPADAPPPYTEDCGTLPDTPCWHLIHYDEDMCGHLCPGCGVGPCRMHDSHTTDTGFRTIAAQAHSMLMLETRFGMDIGPAVAYFTDALPRWMALQHFHSSGKPTEANAIEKICVPHATYDSLVGVFMFRMKQLVESINVTDEEMPGFDCHTIWRLEQLESNVRYFLLRLPNKFLDTYRQCAETKRAPIWKACRTMLTKVGILMNLDGAAPSAKQLPKLSLKPLPSAVYGQTVSWPAVLKRATVETGCSDWRLWVVSAGDAGPTLAEGRANPDRAAHARCLRHLGGSACGQPPCNHGAADINHPDRRLCILLSTLRNIKFVESVADGVGAGVEVSIHRSMLRLLTQAWLPCVLALDRLATDQGWPSELHQRHGCLFNAGYKILDRALTDIYQPRPKFGGGRIERADRSWLLNFDESQWVRPDVTVCRTISWSQAVDMHMTLMEKIVRTLCFTRLLVPPLYDKQGREVHPTPSALLARAEFGALLLLRAFLPLRDGQRASHLVDASQLPEDAALALDLRAWLHMYLATMQRLRDECVVYMHTEPPAELSELIKLALKQYERPLRFGSLLEFLALRQVHVEPLIWTVKAHELASRGQPAAAVRAMADRVRNAPTQLFLPPIHELRSRASRASPASLPADWSVRLWMLKRVLSDTNKQPRLLESAFFSLHYQLHFDPFKLPEFKPAKPPETEAELFSLDQGDPVGLCDHVYELGEMLLQRQADGLMYDYRIRQDHITDGLEPFVKPFCGGPGVELAKAAKFVKRVARPAANHPGTDTPANGTDIKPDSLASEHIVASLTQQLSALLQSKDPLGDIPGPPPDTGAVKLARRRLAALATRVLAIPECDATSGILTLIDVIEQQLSPADGKAAGSTMPLIDVCLDSLKRIVDKYHSGGQLSSTDSIKCAGASDAKHNSAKTTPSNDAEPVGGSKPTNESVTLNDTKLGRSGRGGQSEEGGGARQQESELPAGGRCSFCERRGTPAAPLQLCSLCVQANAAKPRAYCGRPCQTDDWQMGHWEEHQ